MLNDPRRCIGCQSCTVSCTIETKRRRAQAGTTVNQYQSSVKRSEVTNALLPRLCNHCDNPCVPVFPVLCFTFQREDGIAVVDNKRVSAALCCVRACPYTPRRINHETQPPINARFASIVWKPDCYPLA